MRRCLGCMEDYGDDRVICPLCGYNQKTPVKESFCLSPGTILKKRYIVGRLISYDNFEAVYIACDALTERKALIREYLPQFFCNRAPDVLNVSVFEDNLDDRFEEGLMLFLDEAEQLVRFNSLECIPTIIDSFHANNTGYIITDYFSATSVRTILQNEYVLSYKQAFDITMRVLSTLKATHSANIVHCNISPDNVVITDDGEVRLLAFGKARLALLDRMRPESSMTPGYSAPEQYIGQGEPDPQSDVYATAAVFYYMITGISPPDALARKKNDTLRIPSKAGASLPKSVEFVIMNALILNNKGRIKSADEFEAALLSAENRNKKQMPTWAKAGIICLGVLVLAGIALLLINIMTPDNPEEPPIVSDSGDFVDLAPDETAPTQTPTGTQTSLTSSSDTESSSPPVKTGTETSLESGQ